MRVVLLPVRFRRRRSEGPLDHVVTAPVNEGDEWPRRPSRARTVSAQCRSRIERYESVPAARRRDDALKTGREKAEEKRQAKLATVREQVESGSLVIRQMTLEERRRNPPRPVKPKRVGKR